MANEAAVFRRNGDKFDYACTGDVAVGDVIALSGGIVGVAETAGANGDVIALTTVGVFEFKTDAAAITAGAKVYLKSDGTVTATADSNTYLGIAWSEGAATSGATVQVKINTGYVDTTGAAG